MKIESLNEFIVVAHHLNFTSAATKLHISQSNLSKHISELEQELGVELIQRGKQLKLTAAGMAFHEDAIQLHHMYRNAIKHCKDVASQTEELLTIQEPYIFDVMGETLYKAAKKFRDDNPYIMLRFSTEHKKKSFEALDGGKIDIAFTVDCCDKNRIASIEQHQDVIFFPVVQEPLRIWCQKDHLLTKLDKVYLKDIVSIPLNMTTIRCFDPMRYAVLDLFEERFGQGCRPNLRTFPSETLNEFFMNTQDPEAIFLVTEGVLRLPLLQMNKNMTSLALTDEEPITITSYLVVKADYSKLAIDKYFRAVEDVANDTTDLNPEVKFLAGNTSR